MLVDLGAFAFALTGLVLALQLGGGLLAVLGIQATASRAICLMASRLTLPLLALVFAVLIAALITNDYDLLFVANNTTFTTPLLYKVVGVWGNHEGSLILWMLVLALFLVMLSRRPIGMPERTHTLALVFLGLILAAFYGFSGLMAYPFAGNDAVPPGSGDLNPLLQDIGQSIHPPMLYLGYTATAVTFAMALAVLVDRQLDGQWASWLRTPALLSWTFLTAGLALGSWWAYYELGWGGWWFWDPVENLALMPWLLGTALIHSLQVTAKRGQFAGWSLLLALLTFLMVMLGTFIVRSGLLTSVHSFAVDPGRGLYLLLMLITATVGALAAYAYGTYGRSFEAERLEANREGALLLNNLLLMTLFIAVLAGTLAPTGIELLGGETYVVREAYFNPTFVYPSLLLVALMGLGVWTRWSVNGVGQMVGLGILLAVLMVLFIAASLLTTLPLTGALVLALGLWLLGSSLWAWVMQVRAVGFGSPAIHGWALAHVGLAIAFLGMGAASTMKFERSFEMEGPMTALDGSLNVGQRVWLPGQNYWSLATRIEYEGRLRPTETRLYHPAASQLNPATNPQHQAFLADQAQPTSEAAIFRGLFYDVFVTVQDRVAGVPILTVSRKYGINWIWAGAILMTLGGALAMTGRRKT